jgi:hypothetical protein
MWTHPISNRSPETNRNRCRKASTQTVIRGEQGEQNETRRRKIFLVPCPLRLSPPHAFRQGIDRTKPRLPSSSVHHHRLLLSAPPPPPQTHRDLGFPAGAAPMADSRGRWSWDVPGFEPPTAAPTAMPRAPPTAMVLRPAAGPPHVATGGAVPLSDRLENLADSVQVLTHLAWRFGFGIWWCLSRVWVYLDLSGRIKLWRSCF